MEIDVIIDIISDQNNYIERNYLLNSSIFLKEGDNKLSFKITQNAEDLVKFAETIMEQEIIDSYSPK